MPNTETEETETAARFDIVSTVDDSEEDTRVLDVVAAIEAVFEEEDNNSDVIDGEAEDGTMANVVAEDVTKSEDDEVPVVIDVADEIGKFEDTGEAESGEPVEDAAADGEDVTGAGKGVPEDKNVEVEVTSVAGDEKVVIGEEKVESILGVRNQPCPNIISLGKSKERELRGLRTRIGKAMQKTMEKWLTMIR